MKTCRRPPLQERPTAPCTSLQGTLGNFAPCARSATPSRSEAPLLGLPSPCKALKSVVSTASCAPPCSGRPSTTTSKLRASSSVAVGKSMSHTKTRPVGRAVKAAPAPGPRSSMCQSVPGGCLETCTRKVKCGLRRCSEEWGVWLSTQMGHNQGCNPGMAFLDHRQTVHPTGPIGCLAWLVRLALFNPSRPSTIGMDAVSLTSADCVVGICMI